jgi:integrase
VEPETAKTGTGRVLPLSAALYAMLKRRNGARPLPHVHGEDHVFTDEAGAPLTPHTLRVGLDEAKAGVRTDAEDEGREPSDEDRKALERLKAKLAAFRFHDARHTAASLLVAQGVPLFDVAKLLGHKTVQMSMRYAHFAPEAGRSAVNALGEALASGA